jgi:hypothetical protein
MKQAQAEQAPPPQDRSYHLAKTLALLVTAAGLAVMAGWVLDIGVLKSIRAGWVSMKFVTAIAFVLSGVTLYFLARVREGAFDEAQVALPLTALMIALLMGLLFFSTVLGMHTGIEDLFVKDSGDARSVAPGLPSLPTMGNFLLVALAAILALLSPARLLLILRAIGISIGAIGALAALGYVFGVPLLYYYIEGLNSAMALHTALLFVLLGTGLACL